MNRTWSWLLAAPLVVSATGVLAQTPPPSVGLEGGTVPTPTGKSTVLLGALIGFGPQYEGSDDFEPAFGPTASVRWAEGYGAALGPSTMRTYQLRADLLPSRTWHFGPLLQRRPGRKGVDNNRVDDLENIDAAWEAGAHFGYWLGVDPGNPASRLGINIQAVADASDTYNGWLAQPGLEYATKIERWFLDARVFSTYASENYMQEYFGIGASNVRDSGLDFYNADAGFKDVGLRIVADYQFSTSWSVGGGIQYIRLIDDAADSPVTDQGSEDQWFGGVGLSYRF